MSPPADFSIMARERLVAHIWKRDGGGKLRRAGAAGLELCDVPWAEIHVFDVGREKLLSELVARSADLEAYLFELQLEELAVRPGAAQPSSGSRSF